MFYCLLSTATAVSKQTVKPGCKKAAVRDLLWSPTLVRRLCIMLLAQCAIEGVVIILFLVLEIDNSRLSESSSPPPSEKVKTRGRSAASLPKGMSQFII